MLDSIIDWYSGLKKKVAVKKLSVVYFKALLVYSLKTMLSTNQF